MKTKLLIYLCILALVTFLVGNTYACPCDEPFPYFTVAPSIYDAATDTYYVCVGHAITFDARTSYDPDCHWCTGADYCGDGIELLQGIRQFRWDFSFVMGEGFHSECVETPGDGIATYTYGNPGPYTVRLFVTDNDKPCCCDDDPNCWDWSKSHDESVVAVMADLDIIKPNGLELDEDREETDGEVVNVNIDDDDDDGGPGGHGQTSITSDKDDTDGVLEEDDLIRLKIHKICPDGVTGTFKIVYSNANIAIWKQNNKTQVVESDITEFPVDTDTIIYVEGKEPHGNIDGDIITLRFIKDGDTLCEDNVKIIVADMILCLFGHGAPLADNYLETYLNTNKKDIRTDPYIVEGKDEEGNDLFYGVHIWSTEKLLKIAMAAEDAFVSFAGHSNFGMGFSFTTGNENISEFVNVAEDLVAIQWPYLRDKQDHPELWIEDANYGDDTTTEEEEYDPVRKICIGRVKGVLDDYDADRYYDAPVTGGSHCTFHDGGATKWHDYHQPPSPPSPSLYEMYLVVKSGSADMPAKRWKKIYLHSCSSGPYFYDIFNYGTQFYTYRSSEDDGTIREFVKSVIEGKNNNQILAALNEYRNGDGQIHHDYHEF